MADSSGEPVAVGRPDGRWAWTAALFGGWLIGGVLLVSRALNRGEATDVGISPYHVVVYTGLLALSVVSLGLVVRARRRGLGWREAFPAGYGSLGTGVAVLIATLVADVAWREGVGINGIENTYAPSRVLLAVGLALIAMAPLRASLLTGGERGLRWPAAISAGLLAASLMSLGSLNTIANPWLEKPEDVVEDNSEVWLMDADGGRQTRLIKAVDGAAFGTPVWSPDATRIAYTRTESPDDPANGDIDIWVVNADGTDAHPFATGPTWQWFPRWSPDGAWLAYTDEAVGGPWLSSGPTGPDTGQGPQGPVFAGANAASLPEAELWRMPVDGSGPPQRITNAEGDDRSGSWSPDGSRLAFDSTRDGNTELYITNADGSNPARLTDDPAQDWAASWSPDGTKIAFTSDRTGLAQIWEVNVDGSGLRRLTDDPGGALWPSWSPDGSRIAFTIWSSGIEQVWSMAADGTDLRDLSQSRSTTDATWDGSWGSDGRIAFTRANQPLAVLQPIVREDLGVAAMLASALVLALVIGLLIRVKPAFGGVALASGIVALAGAMQTDSWPFVPAVFVAGLLVDVLLRLVAGHRRLPLGTAAIAGGFVAAVAATALFTTGIAWSPTLGIGIAMAAAIAGWGIGALIERHAFITRIETDDRDRPDDSRAEAPPAVS